MQALFHGITLAAASGLLLGAAFKPDLTYGEAMLGPQILLPAAGDRLARDQPQVQAATMSGQAPDYVIGYDWVRPDDSGLMAADYGPVPLAEPDYEPVVYVEPVRRQPAVRVARVAPPPVEVTISYPSLDGDVAPRRQAQAQMAVAPAISAPASPTQVAFAPYE